MKEDEHKQVKEDEYKQVVVEMEKKHRDELKLIAGTYIKQRQKIITDFEAAKAIIEENVSNPDRKTHKLETMRAKKNEALEQCRYEYKQKKLGVMHKLRQEIERLITEIEAKQLSDRKTNKVIEMELGEWERRWREGRNSQEPDGLKR